MELRDYQEDAVEAAISADGNALVVIPTGGGKGYVIGGIIQKIISLAPSFNFLVLQHRKELVEQNYSKFMELCPSLWMQAGVFSASVGQKERRQITFAQIQSIWNHDWDRVNVVIIDEVHRIKREDLGMYRSFLSRLKEKNESLGLMGLTATPFRTESGIIMERSKHGEPLFPEISYDIGMRELIDKGYLSNLVSKYGKNQAELKDVRVRRGEYVVEDLEKAINPLTQAAVDEIVHWGKKENRKKWLIFSPGVETAKNFAREISSRGIPCEAIHGELGKADREKLIEGFRAGKWHLTNCDILTEGFDEKGIDLIAVARPTKSAGLFVQICGRGLRTAPGKRDCLILDFGGNLERFGAIDYIRPKKFRLGFKLERRPLKFCPACGNALNIAVMACECGHAFERLSTEHEAQASALPVLSQAFGLKVLSTSYKVHRKEGKPPCLRVTYNCEGGDEVKEFICFEHPGYAARKACQWWRSNQREMGELPRTVMTAYARVSELKNVNAIRVLREGKFFRVTGREFGAAIKGADSVEELGVNI